MNHKFEQRSSAFEGDRAMVLWCTVCKEPVARFDTEKYDLDLELGLEDTLNPAILWWQVNHIRLKKLGGQ